MKTLSLPASWKPKNILPKATQQIQLVLLKLAGTESSYIGGVVVFSVLYALGQTVVNIIHDPSINEKANTIVVFTIIICGGGVIAWQACYRLIRWIMAFFTIEVITATQEKMFGFEGNPQIIVKYQISTGKPVDFGKRFWREKGYEFTRIELPRTWQDDVTGRVNYRVCVHNGIVTVPITLTYDIKEGIEKDQELLYKVFGAYTDRKDILIRLETYVKDKILADIVTSVGSEIEEVAKAFIEHQNAFTFSQEILDALEKPRTDLSTLNYETNVI